MEPWRILLPCHRHSRLPMLSSCPWLSRKILCHSQVTVSQPAKVWNTVRALDLSGPRVLEISWAVIWTYCRSQIPPNNSSAFSSDASAMAKTTISVSTMHRMQVILLNPLFCCKDLHPFICLFTASVVDSPSGVSGGNKRNTVELTCLHTSHLFTLICGTLSLWIDH